MSMFLNKETTVFLMQVVYQPHVRNSSQMHLKACFGGEILFCWLCPVSLGELGATGKLQQSCLSHQKVMITKPLSSQAHKGEPEPTTWVLEGWLQPLTGRIV